MMTRNEFELFATALRSERESVRRNVASDTERDLQLIGYEKAVNAVIQVCKASNSRFKPGLFKKACGCAS